MRTKPALLAAAVALAAAAALLLPRRPPETLPPRDAGAATPPPIAAPASYVGQAVCASCHRGEADAWSSSHHAKSMAEATPATVLGAFDGARFAYAGVTSTFFRRGDAYTVRTDGEDGALGDFSVHFTFGVAPLQQYLVELPGRGLQALGIAWDARPRLQGGQRFFHLYPDGHVTHDDALHWTRPRQRWSAMCADCHSTDLRRRYDPASAGIETTYAEIDVACEACHGPGSLHVAWARDGASAAPGKGLVMTFDERRGATWDIDPRTGSARRSRPRGGTRGIDACARCHARRGELGVPCEPGAPIGQAYRVALLDDGLYFPDGQIGDEVFEYGSFLQSRMFHAGVTCSDCHNPHTLSLRAPGSDVCLQCHAADRFRSPAHHHHREGSPGAACVACHMPARTYMVVDVRRDHGFRIPRPDRSLTLGTPNACNACHTRRTPAWAAERVRAWYPDQNPGFQTFAEVLHAGSAGAPGATRALLRLAANGAQPGIARASALARLDAIPDAAALDVVRRLLGDDDPLVRRAAAAAYALAPPPALVALVPVLDDPVRDVRFEATRRLARIRSAALPRRDVQRCARAFDDLAAALRAQSDRPEALAELGALDLDLGRAADAEAAFFQALAVDPTFAPAAVDLADLYRRSGRDAQGEPVLHRFLAGASGPESAIAHHALGLWLVRAGRGDEALAELRRAAELAPEDPRFGYVLAVALRDAGRAAEARHALVETLARHPYHRESLREPLRPCARGGTCRRGAGPRGTPRRARGRRPLILFHSPASPPSSPASPPSAPASLARAEPPSPSSGGGGASGTGTATWTPTSGRHASSAYTASKNTPMGRYAAPVPRNVPQSASKTSKTVRW